MVRLNLQYNSSLYYKVAHNYCNHNILAIRTEHSTDRLENSYKPALDSSKEKFFNSFGIGLLRSWHRRRDMRDRNQRLCKQASSISSQCLLERRPSETRHCCEVKHMPLPLISTRWSIRACWDRVIRNGNHFDESIQPDQRVRYESCSKSTVTTTKRRFRRRPVPTLERDLSHSSRIWRWRIRPRLQHWYRTRLTDFIDSSKWSPY